MGCVSKLGKAITGSKGVKFATILESHASLKAEAEESGLPAQLKLIEANVPEKWQLFANAWVKSALAEDANEKFRLSSEMAKQIVKFTRSETKWIEAGLVACCRQLKSVAVESGSSENLVQCAYVLSSALPAAAAGEKGKPSDKAVAYYQVACLLFSIHFRLRAFSLAEGIVKGAKTQTMRLPSLESLEASVRAPWHYYTGVVAFVDQHWSDAAAKLSAALALIPDTEASRAKRQVVLMYLIPAKILSERKFPAREFPWELYPAVAEVYKPLLAAVRSGNLPQFKEHLEAHEAFLTSKHLYLAVLKLQPLCRVHLANRAWAHGGRSARVPLKAVEAAFEAGGVFLGRQSHGELAQIMLAQMISEGDLKGVVYGEPHHTLVLKKVGPFPRIRECVGAASQEEA